MKAIKLNLLKMLLVFLLIFLVSSQVKAQENTNTQLITKVSISQPLKQSITVIKNGVLSSKYTIIPGDVISFSVYGEPDFNQPEIPIRPDGYATIEPIGEIYAAGYDIQTLTNLVAEKMSLFVREPQISINIKEFHPASVYVYGAVQNPGFFQQIIQTSNNNTNSKNPTVRTDLRISNVIANAGGITYDADLNHVQVTSDTGEKRELNLWKLISEGDISQNIILRSGDSVYVPKTETIIQNDEEFKTIAQSSLFPETFPVRIIGEVNKAGIYDLSPKTPYINSAIAMAQGYTIDARQKLVQIQRKTPKGNISKINVDPDKIDYVLRPNDLVYVKDKRFVNTIRIADYMNRFLNPVFGFANGYNTWADMFDPTRRWVWR